MSRCLICLLFILSIQRIFAFEYDGQNLLALDYVKAPVEIKVYEKVFKRHIYEVLLTTQKYQFIIGDVDPNNIKSTTKFNMLRIEINREQNNEYKITIKIIGKITPPSLGKVEYSHLLKRQIPYALRLGLYEIVLGKDLSKKINDPKIVAIRNELSSSLPLTSSSTQTTESSNNLASNSSSTTQKQISNDPTASFDDKDDSQEKRQENEKANADESKEKLKSKTLAKPLSPKSNPALSSPENSEPDENNETLNEERVSHGRFIYVQQKNSAKANSKEPVKTPPLAPATEPVVIKKIIKPSLPPKKSLPSKNIIKPKTPLPSKEFNWGIHISPSPFIGTSFHLIQTDWVLKTRTNYSMKTIGANALVNIFDDQSVDYNFHIGINYVSKIKNFSAFFDKEFSISATSKDSISSNLDVGIGLENSSLYFAGTAIYGAELELIKNSFYWIIPQIRFRYGSSDKVSGQLIAYLNLSIWTQSDQESIQIGATKIGLKNELRFKNEAFLINYEFLSFSGDSPDGKKISGTGSSIRFYYSHYFF